MIARRTLSLLTSACLSGLLAPDALAAIDDGTGWSIGRLDLEIRVDGRGDRVTVSGRAELHARERSMGPTLALNNREPVMVFRRLAAPESDRELRVTTDARHPELDYLRLAHVRASEPFARGDVLVVEFELDRTREAPQAVFRRDYALVSWVEAWYPVPIVEGEDPVSSDRVRAWGETRFHLPEGWSAVTNGARTGEDETAHTETWLTEQPVARAFAAGPFTRATQRFGEREIGVYLLAPKPGSARDQAATLAAALEAMEARFGPYPYPAYAIVEVPEELVTWYAASEQGYITARSSAFDVEGGNVPLFAHEAAHGWWGNLVTTEGPGAALCSESLAQYGAVVAIETMEGEEAMRDFLEFSREGYSAWQSAMGYFGIVREGGDKPLSQLARDQWDHDLSDSKGNWFFHMVRQRLGDERFFGTLRGVLESHAGRALSVDELRAAFLSAAPDDQDLERVLEQWLDRTGAPVVEVDWWSIRRGSGIAIEVTQRQAGAPYLLDLPLEIRLRDGSRQIERLDVRERETRIELDMPSRPVEVRTDPEREILMWRPAYGPVPEQLLTGP